MGENYSGKYNAGNLPLTHQLPFGSDGKQGLKQTGPQQSLRWDRNTAKIRIQPIQFSIHGPQNRIHHQAQFAQVR